MTFKILNVIVSEFLLRSVNSGQQPPLDFRLVKKNTEEDAFPLGSFVSGYFFN